MMGFASSTVTAVASTHGALEPHTCLQQNLKMVMKAMQKGLDKQQTFYCKAQHVRTWSAYPERQR